MWWGRDSESHKWPYTKQSGTSWGNLWWRPYTEERLISFLDACTKKLFSVFPPSSSSPSSILLSPALCLNRLPSTDGITRAPLPSAYPEFGLKNGTYRKLHWEEGPNIHYLCPSFLTAVLAMAQLSMAKRLVTSSITLTLQAPSSNAIPSLCPFRLRGGDRFLLLLIP